MSYSIDIDPGDPKSVEAAMRTEWLLTNGLGGYAMGTALGVNTRRYHGLLVAATKPPVGRIIALHSIIEQLILLRDDGSEEVIELSTQQFVGADGQPMLHPCGFRHILSFNCADNDTAQWTWRVRGASISKTISLSATAVVDVNYTTHGLPSKARLRLRPMIAMRDFHSLNAHDARPLTAEYGRNSNWLKIRCGELEGDLETWNGAWQQDAQKWNRFAYDLDRSRGQDWVESVWSPGYMEIICTDQTSNGGFAASTYSSKTNVIGHVHVFKAPTPLAAGASQFVVQRWMNDHAATSVIAGYPWFGDWGRDTMIALPGLMLCTGRFDEAHSTLMCFAKHLRNGLIPNLFDDYGGAAHYNTVDASLWFVHAVHAYVRALLPSPFGRGAGGEGRTGKRTGEFVIDPRLLTLARDLRQRMTDSEQLMWTLFRDRGLLNMKFRRQHPIEPYVVDFYCHDARLVVEIDGGQHNEAGERQKDQKRTDFLHSRGLKVLRFWNHEVLKETEAVLEAIVHALTPDPSPKGRGEQDDLLRACRAIIAAYRNGTDYNIFMDNDGLISAGDESTQLTWMDAARDGVIFTPRCGKAVEINALWHNALMCMAEMADDANEHNDLTMLAGKVAASFRSAFWWDERKCLHDCLVPARSDGASGGRARSFVADGKVRPNQIFAVSLPFSPLNDVQKQAVVTTVGERLLTPFGLRTLDRDDPNYRPRYEGNLFERDAAYHNGTVWPWLMGAYCEALLRVENFSGESKSRVRSLLQPLIDEMSNTSGGRCLGQIAEVYDAEPPHRPSGCPAQAWSVAETLRALTLASDE